MKCPGFTLGQFATTCKKMDLIWNKCGHASLYIVLSPNVVQEGLEA